VTTYQHTKRDGTKGPVIILESKPATQKRPIVGRHTNSGDIEARGRIAWKWLHAEAEKIALTEDRITKEFEPMIPNYGCQCKAKWKVIRKPLTADQKQWAIDRHNDVNRELGKPLWPYPALTAARQV
jgi:hypothetical protein